MLVEHVPRADLLLDHVEARLLEIHAVIALSRMKTTGHRGSASLALAHAPERIAKPRPSNAAMYSIIVAPSSSRLPTIGTSNR